MNSIQWVDHQGNLLSYGAQGMVNNAHITQETMSSVVNGRHLADVSHLSFRDTNFFRAGELHRCKDAWENLFNYANGSFHEVQDWIDNFVNLDNFLTHFKGSYKGINYDCDRPPSRYFPNHVSCKPFASFISKTILSRLASGAIALWGKVGECQPPHLVMPLTIEPSKPRLCNDNRFLNLWTKDLPFSLDSVLHLPKYVHKNSYQTVCDDKSGYDHILLSSNSRTYFGFQWGGWFFVSCTIPFGWKSSAFVYHTTGLVASHYLRSLGIPSSLYIDDRHTGQFSLPKGTLSAAYGALPSKDHLNLALAKVAIFITCYTLVSLGYFIGLEKSTLIPSKRITYLGLVCDSEKQAFTLVERKKDKFLALLRQALHSESLDLLTLQKLGGKCMSLVLAVPGTRMYTNEINLAISRAMRSTRPVKISRDLRRELEHWLFLDTWDGFLPWRSDKHCHIKLYSDSSAFAWGGVLSPGVIEANVCDYWDPKVLGLDIATKETLALNNVLQSFEGRIRNSWVDAYVDSQTLLRCWERQGSRSPSLIAALKSIFQTCVSLNIDLHLHFVPGAENPADAPSRHVSLQDSMLSGRLWSLVQAFYGGHEGHSVDLMARRSNVQLDHKGEPLPFFSEKPMAGALGVNLFAQSPDLHKPGLFGNPYVFPPICLVPHVFKYLEGLQLPYTLVVPDVCPRRFWWPLLTAACSECRLIASKGTVGALLTPSKHGFSEEWPIPWDLYVFRISSY